MLSPFSHRQLPRYVCPRKLAHLSVRMTGSLAISELSRLCDLLANNNGTAVVELVFSASNQRDYRLTGSVLADVSLVCQRCLVPFNLSIECQLKLMMVSTEKQAAKLPDFWEPLFVDDGKIDLYQLIEDEFLLALPIVASHQQDCVTPDVFSYGVRLDEKNADDSSVSNKNLEINARQDSPFQVLKDLKSDFS